MCNLSRASGNQNHSTIYTDKISVTITNTAQRKLAHMERIIFLGVEEKSYVAFSLSFPCYLGSLAEQP